VFYIKIGQKMSEGRKGLKNRRINVLRHFCSTAFSFFTGFYM